MLVAKKLKSGSKIKNRRPVKWVETGKIYASSVDAADILSTEGFDVCPRGTLHTCQGINKSCGGFRWEYA